MTETWQNKLFFGDNLDVLREHVPDESVDLIYLDPPFNSKATYNVLFKEKTGEESAAQITAFEDTWRWDINTEGIYREIVTGAPKKVADLVAALRAALGTNDMMAYLTMMAIRLLELHRVLKPTGSIYLHCDPTASHYLKVLMDAVFDPQNFVNEIVWRRYKRPKGSQYLARRFGASTDNVLFYSKSEDYKLNVDRIRTPLSDEEMRRRYTHTDEKGPYYSGPLLRSPSMGPRPNLVYEYKGFTPGPEGWRMTKEKLAGIDAQGDLFWTKSGIPRRKVRPQDEPGRSIDNLWADIEALGSQAKERLGYPTQKPEALLERIIQASSNEGDVVLDPFCGCGTAIAVAERLNRRWIGIDITHLAIGLIKRRLADTFGDELSSYKVDGVPEDLAGAEALALVDRYQFQWWALDMVHARPAQDAKKKGADSGIDGYIPFFDDDSSKPKRIIIEVKSGKLDIGQIRALKDVVNREKAQIGVFITLEEPTRKMQEEAVIAGFYEPEHFPDNQFPRLQILTIEELLAGKEVQYPRKAPTASFKRAARKRKKAGEQRPLL